MVHVSVIMPVYNDAERLYKSINSFLNQTLNDIELICINDGSTDNSLIILKEFEEKYDNIHVITQNNQGSGKARNNGMANANGEYIGFLDADDIFIDETALEKLYKVADMNNADMVTGNIKLIDKNDKYSPFEALEYYTKNKIIKPEKYGIPWSFYKNIYKKEFLIENNIIFPDLLRGQDPVFLAQILANVNEIYAVPVDVYAYYYVNGANQCNTSRKRYDHMMHYKMVFDYLKDEKFEEIVHQFRYQMLSFIDMMGEEGAKDIIFAMRDIFDDDSQFLKDFEEVFYYTHKENPILKNLTKFEIDPENPRISVIIPIYNVEKYLPSALDSLLNQTFRDFELICINDGSPDNSLSILNDYSSKDSRVKVINKANGGCGSARNRGIDEARGDYIYFFDPDDYVLDNAFEELYFNAIRNESDLVIFKIARFIDGQPIEYNKPYFDFDKVFKNTNFNRFTFNFHDVKKYVMNSAFAPWSKLYRKSFIDNFNDFRFDIGLAFDDVPFHVKSMLRAKRISFVPKFLYHYRYANPTSVNHTSSKNIDIFKIIDIVESFLKVNGYFDELKDEFYEFVITHISYYIESSGSDDYFQLAKNKYEEIDYSYVEILSNYLQKIYKFVLVSNTLKEYQLIIEISNLEDENKKLKHQLKQINKKLNKSEKMNKKLLSSRSWKITKPLRKLFNLFK